MQKLCPVLMGFSNDNEVKVCAFSKNPVTVVSSQDLGTEKSIDIEHVHKYPIR